MPYTLSQNSRIRVGELSHHTLIQFLSKVENKLAKGVKVYDLHPGLTLINEYTGPCIA